MSHGDPDPLGRGLLTAANRAIEIQAKLSGNWVDRSEVANVNDTSHMSKQKMPSNAAP